MAGQAETFKQQQTNSTDNEVTPEDRAAANKIYATCAIWESWQHGEFPGIHDDNEVKRIQKAFARIHTRTEPQHSIKYLRDAYLQRLETGVRSCTHTQAWFEFRQYEQMKKTEAITLDLTDYGAIADRALREVQEGRRGESRGDALPIRSRPNSGSSETVSRATTNAKNGTSLSSKALNALSAASQVEGDEDYDFCMDATEDEENSEYDFCSDTGKDI